MPVDPGLMVGTIWFNVVNVFGPGLTIKRPCKNE